MALEAKLHSRWARCLRYDGWQDVLLAETANEIDVQIASQSQEGRNRFMLLMVYYFGFVFFSSSNTKMVGLHVDGRPHQH